ncbi:MAG: threonine-phosphate decarboxylase [Nitrospirae bacterium]|nr:threonine-phosphate decarboxylase [Nitrospirota bacterium]
MINENIAAGNAKLHEGVLEYAPTEHGGNIYKIAGELGLPEGRLIDFSASINPLGLSKKVKETIRKGMDGLVNYPDPDTSMLRQKIAECHDIDPDAILCGNGSTELIYLIPRALKPERALIPAPTFSEYERACKISRCEVTSPVQRYEFTEENIFQINIDSFISAMQGFNMAFLCNPNNPTGALLQREEILGIAEAARKLRCYLVVDEAFIDFTPEESVIQDVRDNPYLIVLRSMTKFHALTGLRIGYAVFHESLIGRVQDFKEPWTVNNLAQHAAVTALDDMDYIDRTYRLIAREKMYMEKCLYKCGIKFIPSAANYYLLKVSDAGKLTVQLRNKGILIRDCSNFSGLNNSYIRIAVKSRKHNEMLMKELSESCSV